MGLLSKSDLQFEYSWRAITGDDPRIKGSPDNALLNRNEGYEVLYFINQIADEYKLKNKESGLKLEKMIKKHLPVTIRSRANVVTWLAANWDKF